MRTLFSLSSPLSLGSWKRRSRWVAETLTLPWNMLDFLNREQQRRPLLEVPLGSGSLPHLSATPPHLQTPLLHPGTCIPQRGHTAAWTRESGGHAEVWPPQSPPRSSPRCPGQCSVQQPLSLPLPASRELWSPSPPFHRSPTRSRDIRLEEERTSLPCFLCIYVTATSSLIQRYHCLIYGRGIASPS